MTKYYVKVLLVPFACFCMLSCGEESVSLKIRMYPKVNYPEKNYTKYENPDCPFTFEYPTYGVIKKDSLFFQDKVVSDCWFDLRIDTLNTSLHCNYVEISKENTLDKLINDAFTIAGKHNIKANGRTESIIENDYGVKGLFFDIDGPVAMPVQFYLTDNTKHFFRGSLYFNAKVNSDSTAPVLKFMRQDIEKMMETFQWK
jgi:gliding motility-associated lipoprotein GldD